MRVLVLFLLVGVLALSVQAKKKRKFEGDFEFAEEVSSDVNKEFSLSLLDICCVNVLAARCHNRGSVNCVELFLGNNRIVLM